ncbi:hypothetical protein BDV3_006513 [Batrachochytrium dendrobatidis]
MQSISRNDSMEIEPSITFPKQPSAHDPTLSRTLPPLPTLSKNGMEYTLSEQRTKSTDEISGKLFDVNFLPMDAVRSGYVASSEGDANSEGALLFSQKSDTDLKKPSDHTLLIMSFMDKLKEDGLLISRVKTSNSLFRACADLTLGNERLYQLIKDDFLEFTESNWNLYQHLSKSPAQPILTYSQYQAGVFGPHCNRTRRIGFFELQIMADMLNQSLHIFKAGNEQLWPLVVDPCLNRSALKRNEKSNDSAQPLKLGVIGESQYVPIRFQNSPTLKKKSTSQRTVRISEEDPKKIQEASMNAQSQKLIDDEICRVFSQGQKQLYQTAQTAPNIQLISLGSASIEDMALDHYNNSLNSDMVMTDSMYDWDCQSVSSVGAIDGSESADWSNKSHSRGSSGSKNGNGLDGSSKLARKLLAKGEFSPRFERSHAEIYNASGSGSTALDHNDVDLNNEGATKGSLLSQRKLSTKQSHQSQPPYQDRHRNNSHDHSKPRHHHIEFAASNEQGGSDSSITEEEFRQIQSAIELSLKDHQVGYRGGDKIEDTSSSGSKGIDGLSIRSSFENKQIQDDDSFIHEQIGSNKEDYDEEAALQQALSQSLIEFEDQTRRKLFHSKNKGKGRAE